MGKECDHNLLHEQLILSHTGELVTILILLLLLSNHNYSLSSVLLFSFPLCSSCIPFHSLPAYPNKSTVCLFCTLPLPLLFSHALTWNPLSVWPMKAVEIILSELQNHFPSSSSSF